MTESDQPTNSSRIHSIDALRSLTMCLGIIVHISFCYSPFLSKFWFLQDSYQNIIFDFFIVIVRSFRMEVFFFMSGFFVNLMLEKKGYYYFTKNRIIKIVIPFIIFEPIISRLMPLSIGQPILNNTVNYFRPFHLWFMYYLMFIYSSVYICKLLAKINFWQKFKIKMDIIFNKIMDSRFHILVLVLTTFLPLLRMKTIFVDTPIGFFPESRILIYYSIFFYFGWMVKRYPETLAIITKNKNIYLGIAILNILFLSIIFLNFSTHYSTNIIKFMICYFICRASYAVCTWCLMFTIIGYLQTYLNKENKLIRYLSDSSYWLYIMHLPLILFLQNYLFNNAILGLGKPIVIFSISLFMLLIIYHFIILSTFLKYLLDGNSTQIKNLFNMEPKLVKQT